MPGPQMLCVYQFKVVLRGVSPMIWRRLLLRSEHTIADLHYAIQIAMGWSDAHLNRFHIHGKDYGVAHEGGLTFSDNPTAFAWLSSGSVFASASYTSMTSTTAGSTTCGLKRCCR
jgi:hypothetical protein